MSQTLLCPNRHTVAFTEDDRGGEVYCPTCGVACAVPGGDGPPPTARCRNGHEVAFTEDDRGGEVYCPTCGVACAVPGGVQPEPAPAPVQRPRRRGSVFTPEGEARAAAATAGETGCPACGHTIPYAVADYGRTVRCPRCNTPVPVGESLRPPPRNAAPEPTATTPVVARSPLRGLLRAAAAVLLLAGVVAGGVYVSVKHPEALPFDTSFLPWNKALIEGDARPPGDLPPPKADPPLPPRPEEAITLAKINGLLQQADAAAALATARIWLTTLTGQNVPETEPRRARLAQVIPELEQKLQQTRPAAPPTPTETFFKRIEEAAAAIERRDAPAAEASLDAAGDLLKTHPAELEVHRKVYNEYRDLLRQITGASPPPAGKRAEDVEVLLKEAVRLAKPDTVTRAMEVRAEALFLAPRVDISGDQKVRLEKAEKAATTAIRRARGKRAVADAEQCVDDGDDEALRRLIAVAKKELPEFSDDKECLAAYRRAEALARERAPRASGSVFGRAVLFRCDYEDAMDFFRAGDVVPGVEAADRAAARAGGEDDRARVADLVFRALDTAVLHVALSPAGDPERPRLVQQARGGLAKATRWRSDPRWMTIDAELRKQG
jgi:hypothetical protein